MALGATRSSVGDVFKLAGQSEYIGNSHRALQLKNSKMEARSGRARRKKNAAKFFFPDTQCSPLAPLVCCEPPARRGARRTCCTRAARRAPGSSGCPSSPRRRPSSRASTPKRSPRSRCGRFRDFKTRRPVLACHLATPAIRHQRPLHTRRRAASRPCRLAPLAPPHTLVRAAPNALARSAHR